MAFGVTNQWVELHLHFFNQSINDNNLHDKLVMFVGTNMHFPVIKVPSFQEFESNEVKYIELK